MGLSVDELAMELTAMFPGLVKRAAYGETVLFYNPSQLLPAGVYFASFKEQDGPNDRASRLVREGVFRLAFGLPEQTYRELFGPRPPRAGRGKVVDGQHDFAAVSRLTPHPVYAWMGWVQVLSPNLETWARISPLLAEAHQRAREGYEKRVRPALRANGHSRHG